ncbi:Creatinase/aminopeptidase [Agrocybe pediades]|nr:Creatinase/aminopeptidase [Agrocybe pediades]
MWRQAQVWFRDRIPGKVSHLLPSLSSQALSATTITRATRTITTLNTNASDMGAAGTHTVHTGDRLARLRELMRKDEIGVQAFVVPSEDQHSSEYLAHCDERRAFISGFNGSAGCAIVTLDKAFLFTDGRYFLQAEKQLDENWTLMKQGLPDVPSWQEFLYKKLDSNTKIGIDPTLISASDAETLNKQLTPKGSSLVSVPYNLVDAIWDDRPARTQNKVFYLDEKYSGQSHQDKVANVRKELAKKKAKATVVNMLDEVAWLFNLRGSDIDFNPVFFSYAVITEDKVVLFINQEQLDESAKKYFGTHVEIKAYTEFFPYLQGLAGSLELKDDWKVLLGDKASLAVAEAVGEGKYTIARSPLTDLKAIKNQTELEGFRQCHIRDGAALARYFSWLEEQLNNGVELNESQGSDQLEKFRSELDLFMGLSFTTISSTGPNGAIIHYSPDPNDCEIIKKDQIYLCDSGGQYLDGTTDVTRTWHFGTPTEEEKRAFTRVLQGNIAIDTAIFPSGTTGYIIDSFARRALWQDGLDFRHGTGHGVGHFLNVHEGPHGIGTRITLNNSPLKAGMTVSNEPGYYADGRFGIRIENIVLVKEAKTPNNFGDKGYLGFENVTLCPIQTKLVDTKLLSEGEKTWLNKYHEEVFAKVSPLLKNDPRALEWLKRECTAI